jgi:hypothetical protein
MEHKVLMEKIIKSCSGDEIIVDKEDFNNLAFYRWYTDGDYAYRKQHNKKLYMHRVINGTPENMDTDHINGNRLDNRKSNLRTASAEQNARNSKKRSGCTSKYKGVSWCRIRKKWLSHIRINKKSKRLGRFSSELDAARKYNEIALIHFGEFAKLNQIGEH